MQLVPRLKTLLLITLGVSTLGGCGYHQVRTSAHLPPEVHTLYIPTFENHTQLPRIELWMTQDMERALTARTALQVELKKETPPDATLQGTILTETVTPLTYTSNATTTTTSSYAITVTARVVLTDSHARVLFENDNYTFREVYQSTQQLSSFIQEDSPALQRLSKEFAAAVVSDMLESF